MADDAHEEVHTLAAREHVDHPEALAEEGAQGEPVEEKVVKLDRRLTQRINDLRKDFDTTRKAMSKSVGDFQQAVADLKTATENNKASIESLGNSVDLATQHADGAKKSADAALNQAAQVDARLADLRHEYESHMHDVQIALHGQTTPPKHHEQEKHP